MTPPTVFAVLLLAGATQPGPNTGLTGLDTRIDDIIASLPDIIANLPDIIANLPAIIGSLLPNLPNIIGNIFPGLGDLIGDLIPNITDIIENLPNLIGNLPDLIDSLPDIIDNIPEIIASIPDLIASINWSDIIVILPGIFPEIIASIVEIVRTIADIYCNLDVDWPTIVNLIPEFDSLSILAVLPDIIAQLPEIITQLPDIIANIPHIIANLQIIVDNLPNIISNLPAFDWPAIVDLLPTADNDPGVPAVIQEFPSLVQLECGFSSLWAQCCAGTILNIGYILTSARCSSGRIFSPHIRRVRAGTTTRGQGGEVFPISHAFVHPSFNGRDGDIALVRVARFFVYGSNIQRAGISSQGVVIPIGLNVVHAGWGSTAQGNYIARRTLHKVDFRLVSRDDCRRMYAASMVSRTITENMMCVGRPQSLGRKADVRDCGAPVYLQNAVIGVQSFGSYVNQSIPVVATAVSSYSNWIISTAT